MSKSFSEEVGMKAWLERIQERMGRAAVQTTEEKNGAVARRCFHIIRNDLVKGN